MAKNKREVDKAVKRSEIEAAASRLFLGQGYDATSMAMIARDAEVAPNTLYWYYASKDELLVAVLNQRVASGLSELATVTAKPLDQQILWLMQEIDQARTLMTTVHARIEHSPPIAFWHEQFHQMLELLISTQFVSRGADAAQSALDAKIFAYVVEGLLFHPQTQQQQHMVVKRLVALHATAGST